MNIYLIIPLTPMSMLDGARKHMQQKLLENLATFKNDKVIPVFVGEKSVSGDGVFLMQEAVSKGAKIIQAINYLKHVKADENDWVIRLDDIINGNIYHLLSQNIDDDAVVDRYHHFALSGTAYRASSIRKWFPNTMAHRFKHAVAVVGGTFLLAHDHSTAWHTYYTHKQVQFLPPTIPFYIRRISTNSITANQNNTDWLKYLKSFGIWTKKHDKWTTYFLKEGEQIDYQIDYSIIEKVKFYINTLLNKGWYK